MIKFKKIILENFVRFQEQEFNFSNDDQRPLDVISGVNGSGKTTIMRATKWVIHGNTGDPNFVSYKDLLNRDSAEKGEYRFSVKLNFKENNDDYFVTRTSKLKKGIKKPNDESDFETNLTVKCNGTNKTLEEAEDILNDFFPHELVDFYFFHGEDLKQYEKHFNNERNFIKDKIEKVTRIPDLIKIEQCLRMLNKQLRSESSDNEELNTISGKLNDLEDQKEIQEDIIKTNKNLIQNELIPKQETIKKELLKFGGAETVEKIKELEDKKSDKKLDLGRLKNQVETLSSSLWIEPLRKGMNKYLKKTKGLALYMDAERAGVFLNDVKNKDSCPVCGNNHTEKSIDFITKNINEISPEEVTYFSEYKSYLDKYDAIEYEKKFSEMRKVETKITTLELDIEELVTSSNNEKDGRELLKDYDNYKQAIKKAEDEIDGASEKVKEFERDIELYKDQEKKLITAQGKHTLNQEKKSLSLLTANFIQHFKDFLIHRTKTEVEFTANEVFQKIEDKYYELKINEDYQLKMFEINKDNPLNPSDAQILYISLAMITGLKNTAKIDGPMIIDTLFNGVSFDNAIKMINQFDKLAPQLTLIASDLEIRDADIRNSLMQKAMTSMEAIRESAVTSVLRKKRNISNVSKG